MARKLLKLIYSEWLAFLCLLAAAVKYTHSIPRWKDLGSGDEVQYLSSGVNLPAEGLPSAAYGPLYAIWYFLLSLVCPDRADLYYLNIGILTAAIPVLTFLFLRRLNVKKAVALICSAFVLLSSMNLNVLPKPAHFAVVIILCSFIAATYSNSNAGRLMALTSGAFLGAYVRPELWVAGALLFACLVYVSLRGKSSVVRRWSHIAAFIFVAVCAGWIMGVPWSRDGNRETIAFGQHFAVNWVSRAGSDVDPWTNWENIVEGAFGAKVSVMDALIKEPMLFGRHCVSNVCALIFKIPDALFGHISPFLPLSRRAARLETVTIALASVVLIGGLLLKKKASMNSLRRENMAILIGIACYVLVYAGVSILFYPRNHYLVIPAILTLICFACWISSAIRVDLPVRWLALLGVLVIIFTPHPSLQSNQFADIRNTVKVIRSIPVNQSTYILSAETGYTVYAGEGYIRVDAASKRIGFNEFLEQNDIDMIVLSEYLKADLRYDRDPEWHTFLSRPEKYGYAAVAVPESERMLFVKAGLVNNAGTAKNSPDA